MTDTDPLLAQFEAQRERLRGVAYRLLGSLTEADDALQETWIRLQSRAPYRIDNIGGWLTTVISRIALDMLRARKVHRPEETIELETQTVAGRQEITDPEQEALLADSIGIALLVVLERLQPHERLAFVLHDLFGVSFDDIAVIINRTPVAARQLASRARRRIQGSKEATSPLAAERRKIVTAFFTASREGDFAALLQLLDPDVELTVDPMLTGNSSPAVFRGAETVARRANLGAAQGLAARIMLIGGQPGIVVAPAGRLKLVMTFLVSGDRIRRIEIIAGGKLRVLRLSVLTDQLPTRGGARGAGS